MIGELRGTLRYKRPPSLLLDVRGVGYEVEAPMTTFYDLPEPGAEVRLYTHLVVRDDAHLLYGFSARAQRDLFRSLLRVNGVGPRVGLAILSGMTADEFIACMQAEDVARLTCVPGVGRKTAERLVVELRGKLAGGGAEPPAGAPEGGDPAGEAVRALIALGYKPQEAARAVRAAGAFDGQTSEQLIREALKGMVAR